MQAEVVTSSSIWCLDNDDQTPVVSGEAVAIAWDDSIALPAW